MDKNQIKKTVADLYENLPGNILGADTPFPGTSMYDSPLFGIGAADDPLFEEYKKTGVIGPWHMSPKEWLPGAAAVISLFFPLSSHIRLSNRESDTSASALWSYARVEGQEYINSFMEQFAAWFQDQGIETCVPSADPRWQQVAAGKGIEGYPEINNTTFGSRWSERHAAYVCGLGTFGLSKGLITKKGIAGRFGSVIINEPLEPDVRPYTGMYDYCSRCGACIRRCPAHAIDLDHGKDHTKCGPFVEASKTVLYPRYGCGLCQTGVPCASSIPAKTV